MKRILQNILLGIWYFISSFIVISIIIYIFVYIFKKGIGTISLEFLTDYPKGMPLGMEGGILPAILGSLSLIGIACISAGVLGISTAIYLTLYCKSNKLKNIIHLIISSIAGIPSIVIGLFGYSFLVYFLRFGISLLSGGITLGIMIFPYIEIISEKAIGEVDKKLIISSYALGISKSYTFFRIILPKCKAEIISGIVLSSGFALGAAAPVMLTAAVISAPNPNSFFSPVMALPYHLYILITQGISQEKAYATSLVLIFLIILINLLANFVLNFWGRKNE